MHNFQRDYQDSIEKKDVPHELTIKTFNKMKDGMKKSRRRSLKILIPIAASVTLMVSSVTVWAYNSTGGFQKPFFSTHLYTVDSNGQLESTATVSPEAAIAVENTKSADNLKITVKSVGGDPSNMYVYFDVEALDGSPLQEISEFKKSFLVRQEFKNSYLECDGEKYAFKQFRIDKADVPNKASFEAMVWPMTSDNTNDMANIMGKDVKIVLGDFTDDVISCESAGFKFNNLGELYNKMTPENSNNFIKTGVYMQYADMSAVPSYMIPAGNQHIEFSDQFPGAYIDNIGFKSSGEKDCEYDWLYISIVPGNKENADALEKLAFQNIKTGEMFGQGDIYGNGSCDETGYHGSSDPLGNSKKDSEEYKQKVQMQNGRIIIALDKLFDTSTRSDKLPNTTVKDLSNYRLVKNIKGQIKTIQAGHWEIPLKLDLKDTTKTFNIHQVISIDNDKRTINNVTLSGYTLKLSGTRLIDDKMAIGKISLIMKDGAEVPVGVKLDGSFSELKFDLDWSLETPVDADNVSAIKIWGATIPLK